ncbi:MAG: type II toxin-antitoxin system HicA family toxin [Saprospiraceae bacterium]|nr:type II toxin-antitoxin system HicA family toxin [Saprospiraceae bacterium]
MPRDYSALDLIRFLTKFGYSITRQKGSHIRITKNSKKGDHHITISNHDPLKIGTLSSILTAVANELEMNKSELIEKLK